MSGGTDVVVSIAQVAAGGTIVQALVALFRRRGELRQLDRQTDSVAVETAGHVVAMLHTELVETRNEIARLRKERVGLQRRVDALTDELAVARADLIEARGDTERRRRRHRD